MDKGIGSCMVRSASSLIPTKKARTCQSSLIESENITQTVSAQAYCDRTKLTHVFSLAFPPMILPLPSFLRSIASSIPFFPFDHLVPSAVLVHRLLLSSSLDLLSSLVSRHLLSTGPGLQERSVRTRKTGSPAGKRVTPRAPGTNTLHGGRGGGGGTDPQRKSLVRSERCFLHLSAVW